jgi:hypothetical protein
VDRYRYDSCSVECMVGVNHSSVVLPIVKSASGSISSHTLCVHNAVERPVILSQVVSYMPDNPCMWLLVYAYHLSNSWN